MCSNAFVKHLAQSVADGKVTEEDINTACRRILEAKYKLGLFSNPYRYCNAKRNKTDIYSAENRQIARDVAAVMPTRLFSFISVIWLPVSLAQSRNRRKQ